MEHQQKQPYQTINSCTRRASMPQVIAISIFATIEILTFNLFPHILQLNSTYLYVILALKYLTFITLLVIYIAMLIIDPSDFRLKGLTGRDSSRNMDNKVQPETESQKHCAKCKINVAASSYHCNSCKRCVEDFDHHCVFLNNCIGKQNYGLFMKLLITILGNMALNMGLALWLSISYSDGYRWVAVTIACLSFLVFAQVTVLAIFHVYISFYLFKRTVDILVPDNTNKSATQIKQQKTKVSQQTMKQRNNEQTGIDLKERHIQLTIGDAKEELNKKEAIIN